MSKTYDKPIVIQKINDKTERWEDTYRLHAFINKAKSDNEYLGSGAIQAKRTLTFEVRYFKDIEAIGLNTQKYRIVYNGVSYDIVDYDDFKESHRSVKLLGASY